MSFRKMAGIAGVAAMVLIFLGTILAGSPPSPDATPEDVVEYFGDYDTWPITLTINLIVGPLLALFFAGVTSAVRRGDDEDDNGWRIVLLIGVVASFAAVFGISATEVALANTATTLPGEVVDAIWAMNAAMAGYQFVTVGILLLGAGMLTLRRGLGPRWAGYVALVGSAAAILGSLFIAPAIKDGSPLVFISLLGFLAWIVWTITIGLWMVRDDSVANHDLA